MTNLKLLNTERLAHIEQSDCKMSHGLQVFVDKVQQAQLFNAYVGVVRYYSGEEYRRKMVTVYFSWVTDNRLMAHIITSNGDNSTLERLVIPEAGHRLYAHYKDGYQANGGGYSKPLHILEAMVWQARKHTTINNWQDFIKAEVIA